MHDRLLEAVQRAAADGRTNTAVAVNVERDGETVVVSRTDSEAGRDA